MNWAEIRSKVRIHEAGRLRAVVQLIAAICARKSSDPAASGIESRTNSGLVRRQSTTR